MAYINPEPQIDDLDENFQGEYEQDYVKNDEVYFAFIDVLGFKKTFEDIKITQKEQDADKFRDVFNYYFELMNEAKFMNDKKGMGCYAGQTSDSLYFYTERSDFLIEFMKIFSHFNLYAMSQNVFFRGGIAKGNLYKKEKYQFYGNSVMYAYLMESSISKYPIIVIDERTNNDLKDISAYASMVKKKNERYYLNPFKFLHKDIKLDIANSFVKRELDIKKIQENIELNRMLFEYDSRNYEKYVFLKNELKGIDNCKDECTIKIN